MPRLAIVMITYNQESYIEAALDGIRCQTRVPDEVIIGDDGSTDKTPQLIQDYVVRYGLQDRWTLLLSLQNRGITANLQAVVDRSTADILLPMAGDDISYPERCEIVERGFSNNPQAAILLTSADTMDEYGHKTGRLAVKERLIDDVGKAVRRGNALVNAIGQNWRREIFSRFGPLPIDVPNEDMNISFRGLLLGGIACLPEATVRYRVHDQSISSWLHRQLPDTNYYARILEDMTVRERHMLHWVALLEQSNLQDKTSLISRARRKAALYRWLGNMTRHSLYERLIFFCRNYHVISLRDGFYALLGRRGVLIWREVKRRIRPI